MSTGDLNLSLRCDWCGEMTKGVRFTHTRNCSYQCMSCFKHNMVVVNYDTERYNELMDTPGVDDRRDDSGKYEVENE